MRFVRTRSVLRVIFLCVVNSGDPYILNNVIEKNYGNGITTICHDNLRCYWKIRNNEILGNMENGLECCGNTNFCIVI